MTTPRTSPEDGQREATRDDNAHTQAPAQGGQGRLSDHLANQRTMLAWARTGVSLMALGFVVARFGLLIRELSATHVGAAQTSALPNGAANWFGIILIIFGAALVGLSLLRYLRIARGIDEGRPRVTPQLDITLAAGLMLAGLALAVYLALTS